MLRLIAVGMGATLLAFVALACTSETTVLPPGQSAQGISVSGTGSVTGTPDVAVVTLGVEAEAESVGEAREDAAASMEAMIAALKDRGVADEDVQTTSFSVQPRYDFSNNRQQLIGFTVTNLATVKIRSIDDTGELLDAAIEAGGNLARVQNLFFTIDDPTALEDEARAEAMADARRRAETLAEAAGVSVGRPRSINESGGPVPIAFEEIHAAGLPAQDFARTPIELGELEVRVDVQVVFELED